MRFVLDLPRFPNLSPDDIASRWRQYWEYLQSVEAKLPRNAFAYATSAWHRDYLHQMSPHDGWLERLTIEEPAAGERAEKRSIRITIELLGSYHDGHIRFVYPSVKSYAFTAPPEFEMPPLGVGHGDWLTDEVHLSDNGLVIHEILFSRGAQWRIESTDLLYEWVPT